MSSENNNDNEGIDPSSPSSPSSPAAHATDRAGDDPPVVSTPARAEIPLRASSENEPSRNTEEETGVSGEPTAGSEGYVDRLLSTPGRRSPGAPNARSGGNSGGGSAGSRRGSASRSASNTPEVPPSILRSTGGASARRGFNRSLLAGAASHDEGDERGGRGEDNAIAATVQSQSTPGRRSLTFAPEPEETVANRRRRLAAAATAGDMTPLISRSRMGEGKDDADEEEEVPPTPASPRRSLLGAGGRYIPRGGLRVNTSDRATTQVTRFLQSSSSSSQQSGQAILGAPPPPASPARSPSGASSLGSLPPTPLSAGEAVGSPGSNALSPLVGLDSPASISSRTSGRGGGRGAGARRSLKMSDGNQDEEKETQNENIEDSEDAMMDEVQLATGSANRYEPGSDAASQLPQPRLGKGHDRGIGRNSSTRDNNDMIMLEDDDDELGGLDEALDQTVIWGTDIHVPKVARAFQHFIRTFISTEQSRRSFLKQRRLKKKQARRERQRARREAAAASGGDGGGGGDDDDDNDDSMSEGSFSDSDSDDEERETRPLYMEKLRAIAEGNGSRGTGAGGNNTSGEETNMTPHMDIDAMHLFYHTPACQRLYSQLIMYPQEIIPLMDLIVNQLYAEHFAQQNDQDEFQTPPPRIQVRPYNLREISHMRSMDPNSIDHLLSLEGMVVRCSPLIPDLKIACFQCHICGHVVEVTVDRGRINEPTQCTQCSTKRSFALVHNRSIYSNKQVVRLQETPDEVPAGETPASILLLVYDDLVDAMRPGDRVELTGVFRAQPKRVSARLTKVKSVYKTYVDVIHFRPSRSQKNILHGSLGNTALADAAARTTAGGDGGTSAKDTHDLNALGMSPSRVAQIKEFAAKPNIYDILTEALAPSIWELDNVKRGVLCMLFGGNHRRAKEKKDNDSDGEGDDDSVKEVSDTDDDMNDKDGRGENKEDKEDEYGDDEDGVPKKRSLQKRGDINILLCGDPGTSKSQLLSYVHKLAPRGVYTSGKGSSAVGLTASIVRDPETRELVLESGALVLSDKGICCIDEFDKMSDTTRAVLHEAMEQQTVSIAKAGVVATLNARTSILASANPIDSRYNPRKSVVENIQLPHTLLSRFDLIYLILDSPNIDHDRRLAKHLVSLYNENPNTEQPVMDQSLLRDYIRYARRYVHPEISDLAAQELINGYLEMRRGGGAPGEGSSSSGSGKHTISATPRQLESLIRISEALARMKLKSVVHRGEVREAIRLMKVATQAAATDPRTGKIDMDMIVTGKSSSDRETHQELYSSLKELMAERRGQRMAVRDVVKQVEEVLNMKFEVGENRIEECLQQLDADGIVVYHPRERMVHVRMAV